jgi:dTDP-glucose 4,6-dehydratase
VRLGSLEPTRDFLYVADSVEGYLRAAVVEQAIGTTINIGTGREISIGDLAQIIVDMTGGTARVETDEPRTRPEQSEVGRLLADNSLASSLLGWSPQVTLEDGLSRTIDWVRQNPEPHGSGRYAI